MTPEEIEAALRAGFDQCDRARISLTSQQKQLLFQALGLERAGQGLNPLAELTVDERRALFSFIREQTQQNLSWKTSLLNDWLQGRGSGPVQFLRDRYGIQWLEQIQPRHLAAYELEHEEGLHLQVGDRIEVTNGLWEWVQENGPCGREWFPCTVIGIREASTADPDGLSRHASCIVRFDGGAEYEIQGVYEWNRPNWRWLGSYEN